MRLKYHYRSSLYRSARGLGRIKLVMGVVVTVIAVLAFVVGGDLFIQNRSTDMPEATGHTSSIAADAIKVFRTKYFQFQTEDTWVEVSNNNDNEYMYRNQKGALVQQDLTIYVNVEPPMLDITRVQPVSADEDRLVANGPISDHCRVILPENSNPVPAKVKVGGVSFTCRTDGALFVVLVADTKGLPSFRLVRPDGTTAQYTMIYRDLTAYPDGRNLDGIIRSFQTR